MLVISGTIDSNSSQARADAMFASADKLMREWGFSE
jgi:hypothetical protein